MAQHSNQITTKQKATCFMNCIIIGSRAVGKTSILDQYVNKKFNNEMCSTMGTDFMSKQFISESGEKCDVKIWDTAGSERFNSMAKSFYRQAEGVIIVFNLTDLASYKAVKNNWLTAIRNASGTHDEPIPAVLVGNKLDLAELGER